MTGSETVLPRLSVALCTFNSGRFIENQLRSILDQNLPVDEVVIGDDGSSDDTLGRIANIASSHSLGHLVHVAFTKSSGGVTRNFARTLAACSGDLIALSDHDDWWHPEKTAVLVPQLVAAATPAMIFTNARIVNDAGTHGGEDLFGSYGVTHGELDAIADGRGYEALIRRNIVTGATAMLSRDLLDVALPIPERFVHDEWLAFLAASLGTLLAETEPLIDYRVHGNNQIGIPPQSRWAQTRAAMDRRRDRYEVLHSRAEALHQRLVECQAPDQVVQLVSDKVAFEAQRAAMPSFRPARLPGILRRYRRGGYARFTHRPSLERWRDLVQPM